MKKIVIACTKKWFLENKASKKFLDKKSIIIIKKKNQLNLNYIKKINPYYIFFPHWSFKVKKQILNNYNCICFHTAPLPYGRGGSPIQNLISRNFKKTNLCALKMTDEIDGGPIYKKEKLSLNGNLDEIFNRISLLIIKIINDLLKKNITPKKQVGKILKFKRRNKRQSEITETNINKIYDKIRMLSSKEYPNAFLKYKNYKIYFSQATLKKNMIICNAKIFKN